MRVIHALSDFPMLDYAVVTSGTYDGLHTGHQKIIKKLVEIAQQKQGKTIVITFFPHPRMVLSQGKNEIKELFTLEEKISFLENLGVDYLLVLPFTNDFSQMSPDDFIQKIYINTLKTKYLVMGYDHRFGKNREGGLDFLLKNQQKYNFEIEEIPRHDIENIAISSTKIREAIAKGEVEIAKQYLGYNYSLKGKVIKGDQIGRTLGFPTANIFVKESYKLIPKAGIYAVKAFLENEKNQNLKGMCYIGNRPTLEKSTGEAKTEKRIEVNIFDFEEEIYDKILKIEFLGFVREDKKFDSLTEMTAQIQQDKKIILDNFF